MKQRPNSIVWISALFWALSVGFLVMPFHLKGPLSHLHSLIFGLGAFVVGFGIFNLRLWGYWTFCLFSLGLMVLALMDFFRDQSLFVYMTVVGTAGALSIMYYFIQKHVAAPYYNPQLHAAPYRFKTRIRSQVALGGERHSTDVLDISQSGCFIDLPGKIRTGEILCLHLDYGPFQMSLMSRVVRRSRDPQGYGLMFLDLEKTDRRILNQILDEVSFQYYQAQAQQETAS